MQTNTEPTEQV